MNCYNVVRFNGPIQDCVMKSHLDHESAKKIAEYLSDCYLKRGWSSIKFAYFMDDKGYKYDGFLKRIRDDKKKN